MSAYLPSVNPARLRSYLFRLPLFTRVTLVLILVTSIAELQSAWDVMKWGALIPQEVGFGTSMLYPVEE